MTRQTSLERIVASWMADEAAGVAPEQTLDQILTTTGRMRPRPRWLALLQEPPMRTQSRLAVGVPSRALVLAAVVALILAALVAIAVGAGLLRQPQPTVSTDWTIYRGDSTHNSIGLTGPVGRPKLNWRFQATGGFPDNVSIVGTTVYAAADDGVLHAISLERGGEVWSVPGLTAPIVGPSVADGRVYLVDGDGRVAAFGEGNGAKVWASAVAYPHPNRLVPSNGALYFGIGDGSLVALDAATGLERWHAKPAQTATAITAPPAVSGGIIYSGTVGGGLDAVDAGSGKLIWQADTGSELTGTPVVAEGIAYIGLTSGETTSAALRAFDAKSGRPLWTSDRPLFSPVVRDGVGYTASDDGTVVALDTATGAIRWQIAVTGAVRPPVLAGNVLYFSADSERRVYAVEAATGNQLWHFDLDSATNCCVAVAKGAVFVGTQTGSLYSIGGDGASIAAAPFPSPARPSPSANPVQGSATPAATPSAAPMVTFITKVSNPDLGIWPATQIARDPSGRIWVPAAAKDRFAIFDADGTYIESWGASGHKPGEFKLRRSNGDGYGTLAFASDGSFYVLDVGNRRVQAFDAKRHFVREWGGFGTGPGQYSDPVGIAVDAKGLVYVLDDRRSVVERYDKNGKVLGSIDPFTNAPANDGANGMALDSKGNIYVSQISPNQVAEFSPSGDLIRTFGSGDVFPEQPTQMALDAAGDLFVTQGADRGDAPGVIVFDPNGSVLGGFGPAGAADDQIVFPAGITLDGKGTVFVLDTDPDGDADGLLRFTLLAPLAP